MTGTVTVGTAPDLSNVIPAAEAVAPVAPAPAPAAPPATPAAPAAEPAAPAAAFEPTGDAGLDLAASWAQEIGFSLDDPILTQALETGDFSLLKAKLASMGDKARGWEQYIALAEQGIGNLTKASEARDAEVTGIVHETVGGEENWNQIKTWASQNAEPAEKEAINAMFNAGGVQAKAAAMLLQNLYSSAGGTVVAPKEATASAPAGQAPSNSALSPDAYRTALSDLVSRVGAHRINGHPEYAALQQRRLAFRG